MIWAVAGFAGGRTMQMHRIVMVFGLQPKALSEGALARTMAQAWDVATEIEAVGDGEGLEVPSCELQETCREVREVL